MQRAVDSDSYAVYAQPCVHVSLFTIRLSHSSSEPQVRYLICAHTHSIITLAVSDLSRFPTLPTESEDAGLTGYGAQQGGYGGGYDQGGQGGYGGGQQGELSDCLCVAHDLLNLFETNTQASRQIVTSQLHASD